MTSEALMGLSVLVLEDEPLWRRHLVASLERSPCRLIQRTLPMLCKEPGV